jgi:hypothetical protein
LIADTAAPRTREAKARRRRIVGLPRKWRF